MRIAIFLAEFFFLFATNSSGMEDLKEIDDEIPITLEACRKKTLDDLDAYRAYFVSMTGDGVFEKFQSTFFPSKKQIAVSNNLKLLDKFSDRLQQATSISDLSDEIFTFSETCMKFVANEESNTFLHGCLDILVSIDDSLATTEDCCFCMEHKKVIGNLPCGHFSLCRLCKMEKGDNFSKCLVCLAPISTFICVKKPCIHCNKQPVRQLSECGHYGYCDDCFLKSDRKINCAVCGLATSDFTKIYP